MRTSCISRLPWDSTNIYSDSLFSWPRRRASMHWLKSAFKWLGTLLQRKLKSPLPSLQSPRASLEVFHLIVCPLPSLRIQGSSVRLDLRQARDCGQQGPCIHIICCKLALCTFSHWRLLSVSDSLKSEFPRRNPKETFKGPTQALRTSRKWFPNRQGWRDRSQSGLGISAVDPGPAMMLPTSVSCVQWIFSRQNNALWKCVKAHLPETPERLREKIKGCKEHNECLRSFQKRRETQGNAGVPNWNLHCRTLCFAGNWIYPWTWRELSGSLSH